MSIEKLELVSIAGDLPQLNEAITACLRSKVFHIENAAKLLGSAEDSGGAYGTTNPYAEPLRSLLELDLRKIKIDPDAEPLPAEFTPEQILSETKRISERLKDVRAGIASASKQITDYESAAIHLKHLQRSELDLGELTKCKHILYRFGRMPEENVQKLEFYSDAGFIFQAYHTAHEYVWGFYFASQERIMVPRFPRLDGRSKSTKKGVLESLRVSKRSSRISMMAISSEVSVLSESSERSCDVRL